MRILVLILLITNLLSNRSFAQSGSTSTPTEDDKNTHNKSVRMPFVFAVAEYEKSHAALIKLLADKSTSMLLLESEYNQLVDLNSHIKLPPEAFKSFTLLQQKAFLYYQDAEHCIRIIRNASKDDQVAINKFLKGLLDRYFSEGNLDGIHHITSLEECLKKCLKKIRISASYVKKKMAVREELGYLLPAIFESDQTFSSTDLFENIWIKTMSRLEVLYPHSLYTSIQTLIQNLIIKGDREQGAATQCGVSSSSRIFQIALDVLAAVPLMYKLKTGSSNEVKACPVYLTEEVAFHALQEAWKQCDEEVRVYASRFKKLGHKKCSSRKIKKSIQKLDCLTKYTDIEEANRIQVVKEMFEVFFKTKLLDDINAIKYFKEHLTRFVKPPMFQSTAALLQLVQLINDGSLTKQPDAVIQSYLRVLSPKTNTILRKILLICKKQQITVRIRSLDSSF